MQEPTIKLLLISGFVLYFIGCEERKEEKPLAQVNSNIRQVEINAITNSQNLNTQEPLPAKYIACGCGCCDGNTHVKKCLYHSKGDDLRKIIEADKKSSTSKQCERVGCASGVEYKYCD
jgi:hypothetical protein